jgi:hypothetical protein
VKSSAATTATARFTYGPAALRDRFLDWARDAGLPTGSGREALFNRDDDSDKIPALIGFLTNGNPNSFDPQPVTPGQDHAEFILRDLLPEDGIALSVQFSGDLATWETHPERLAPAPDQAGVPAGFTRMRVAYPPEAGRLFLRLHAK